MVNFKEFNLYLDLFIILIKDLKKKIFSKYSISNILNIKEVSKFTKKT